jgi:hypothetical protein
MTNININTNTDTDTEITMVAVDMLDAVELAEICEYLRDWIGGAPPAVSSSLARFGGPDAQTILLDALARLADTLMRAVPTVTPHHRVRVATALSPGEALGLAEVVLDLAVHHWPTEPAASDALEDDCRRWALRLARTPGLMR